MVKGQPQVRAGVQRRTLRVLVVTQLLGGVGLAAGVAVGALLAADLLEGQPLTGLPAAVATAGGAGAAVPISRLMARSGRRPGWPPATPWAAPAPRWL